MNIKLLITICLITLGTLTTSAQDCHHSQWHGKRAAYLGDSMTDPRNSTADRKYWACLEESLGLEANVFARSGYQWDRLLSKAHEMQDSLGSDIDVIFIWCGTNDYNHNTPIGEFYTETVETVNYNGTEMPRKHRQWVMGDSTLCGRINRVMSFLKHDYPDTQIILMTPIHRGYAKFSDKNVQPDEDYANALGLYIEDYIDVLRRAADLWAVPMIDLYSISGLYPNDDSYVKYMGNGETDRLHPNNAGHQRLARIIEAQLTGIPPLR